MAANFDIFLPKKSKKYYLQNRAISFVECHCGKVHTCMVFAGSVPRCSMSYE